MAARTVGVSVLTLLLWLSASACCQGQDAATVQFFFSPTCVHCHPVKALLGHLSEEPPGFTWVGHPLTEPENIELMTEYYIQYEVPEEQWSGTLALFAGDRWWVDGERVLAELADHVASSGPVTPVPARTEDGGAGRLQSSFEGFSVLTVAGAGLLDGINPCALATLIFLLSYLGLTGRSRGQVLAVGLAFAAGVFLAYLAVGLGALRAIKAVDGLSLASRLVYPTLAGLTLALAVMSFRDYRRASAGDVEGMALKLPRRLTLANHHLIKRLLEGRACIALAFVAGAAISILELFCTGQVYLPTLMYMWSVDSVRAKVIAYLVLYVGMFVLPIVALAGAVYAGMGAKALAQFARERTGAVKLATAGLFTGLGVYLAIVSLRLFGFG